MTAELPLQVESPEELVYLLGEACEIEHGLMCEYLYAQFSLKRTAGEGLALSSSRGCRYAARPAAVAPGVPIVEASTGPRQGAPNGPA